MMSSFKISRISNKPTLSTAGAEPFFPSGILIAEVGLTYYDFLNVIEMLKSEYFASIIEQLVVILVKHHGSW